jgi:Ser/Thr protein kinase RdoA (MazF antagonist)
MLAHVSAKERTSSFLSSVGKILGRCDCSLSKFSSGHLIKVASERNHFWDLRNALRLKEWTGEVTNSDNRVLLTRAFGLFELHAGHLLIEDSPLRSQVTHQDGNDYNIVVRRREEGEDETTQATTTEWSMVGLIDFGDIVHTNLICNLAVALAYLCCHPSTTPSSSNLHDDDDKVSSSQYAIFVSSSVVQGYVEAMPLDSDELDVLWWCMIGRICHSLASSSHRQLLEPENKYLVVSEAPFWTLLHSLSHPSFEANEAAARESFRQIVKA